MTERKHTPGPWSPCDVGWGEPNGAFEIEAASREGNYVVIASRKPWPHRIEESRANARLIAAAPELLAALEFYAAPCDAPNNGPCPYEGNLCCQTARVAIAKATEG